MDKYVDLSNAVKTICLDGDWEAGINREYNMVVKVPGLVCDPSKMCEGTLWYRREVYLPEGDWTFATLELKGARFCPAIYVNGVKTSESEGGMTITKHVLNNREVKPGRWITLEIALKSLKDVDLQDASRIPTADHWRTNISSHIWDSVNLHMHGSSYITRIIPFSDLNNDRLTIYWELENKHHRKTDLNLTINILDHNDLLIEETFNDVNIKGKACIDLNNRLERWSPEYPKCYRLQVILMSEGKLQDIFEMTLGLKEFKTQGLKFFLNGNPICLRAGSVVWHRWVRDPEARELAFDVNWFEENIVLRLKSHGANTLRFHLGNPPEAFLDLCDKYGLMVQAEWIFFHGMEASPESLFKQWRDWLDLCMRHPSVCIIHPWNETEGEALKTAFEVLEELSLEYPPLVISHRDVIHIHKYWWSMFENVGVYYDSATQFDKPIMVDEFGGNYLDGEGNTGGYPRLKEGFLRFLGINHTKELRLQLHTESNARIAEYWRRIGAAGFSPFCILGSPEDGNHHFLGRLKDAKPKPVWGALTAAYSPLSISIDIWDRNFVPGGVMKLPVYFFNDTETEETLEADISFVNSSGRSLVTKTVKNSIKPYFSEKKDILLELPEEEGEWELRATLRNGPDAVKHDIVSSWKIRTINIKVPEELTTIKIAVPEDERELKDFLSENNLKICRPDSKDAGLLLTSRITWESEISCDNPFNNWIKKFVEAGKPVVMLDIGPIKLGQGYLSEGDTGPLQGRMSVKEADIKEYELTRGIKVIFRELSEPESCIHPTELGKNLWNNLDRQATWLWNGLKGGLIVPVYDMEITGLNPTSFLNLWKGRGADESLIKSKSYYAFEIAGFYSFSVEMDEKVVDKLRDKVKFLVEDAPSLKETINPDMPARIYDLAQLYQQSLDGAIENIDVLVACGKNLSRTPVYRIDFGEDRGKLILSQLITCGRLAQGYGSPGHYGKRYDPACVQFVLNMMKSVL